MNYALIKVCGMREAENIREVEKLFTLHSSLFTFWMGFIFWPKSSRYVSERPAYLPTKCKRVGVFVDEDAETIRQIADDYALDYIQLHGHESPDFIRGLRNGTAAPLPAVGVPPRQWERGIGGETFIIKAFNIATKEDLEATKPYEGLVDYFLFDAKAQLPGGSGQQFDWSVLKDYDGDTPFLLSGGIGPDDAERVKAFLTSHKCIGIDLNSRFEIAPGLKDINKLKSFIEKVKS